MATHAAAPDSTRSASPHLPQEDIGSVLDRFQKWTGHKPEPVRELTYEEAAARSRRRVYADEDAIAPATGKAASVTAEAKPSSAKSKAAKAAQPGNTKSSAKAAAKPPRAATKRPASRKSASQQPAQSTQAAAACPIIPSAVGEVVSAPPADFQTVFAAQFHTPAAPLAVKAEAKSITPLSGNAPSVHLTVRFATEERDAVRERAHDLGIAPSAYIRHCILEIDSLRAELETARLAYAQAFGATLANVPALNGGSRLHPHRKNARSGRPSNGAWFTRLIHCMLPAKTKGHALSTSA